MHLLRVRVVGVGPIDDLSFSFADDTAAARKIAVVLGAGAVGKTSLLASIAATRPGHAVALPRARTSTPFAVADYWLGDDDPTRPHALRVASPNAVTEEREDDAATRRREQALFDRRAADGGFVAIAFPSGRWFSRSPLLLTAPERTILRHDPRATPSLDDGARVDLARDTKSALAYAALIEAVAGDRDFARAMREAVAPLAEAAGFVWSGVDARSFEPTFDQLRTARSLTFDELPTAARHVISFAALTTRALRAAYPGRDPRQAEGVALIDDADLHLDEAAQRALAPALRAALPNVQWILTSSSLAVALGCDTCEVLALRRAPDAHRVELYGGADALVH